MSCEHKYVDMEDGTRDKFCVRCSKKFKQAAAYIDPKFNPEDAIIAQTINVNIEVGSEETAVDNIIKEINKNIVRAMTYN